MKTTFSLGVLGIAVTVGLFIYEMRSINRASKLIKAGEKVEKKLFEDGLEGTCAVFSNDQRNHYTTFGQLAAFIIYFAVGWIWLFVFFASSFHDREAAKAVSIIVGVIGIIAIVICVLTRILLKMIGKNRLRSSVAHFGVKLYRLYLDSKKKLRPGPV